jgi:hypothetical protein
MPTVNTEPSNTSNPEDRGSTYSTALAEEVGITWDSGLEALQRWEVHVSNFLPDNEGAISGFEDTLNRLRKDRLYRGLLKKISIGSELSKNEKDLKSEIDSAIISIFIENQKSTHAHRILSTVQNYVATNPITSLDESFVVRDEDILSDHYTVRSGFFIDPLIKTKLTKSSEDVIKQNLTDLRKSAESVLWQNRNDYSDYIVGCGINFPNNA